MDPRHRELAEIALRAPGGGYGLALAGGYAVREHGMGNRPSGDVDLFTDWQRRADFPAAADLVIEALTDNGFVVDVLARADTFARLLVSRPDELDVEPQKMELRFLGFGSFPICFAKSSLVGYCYYRRPAFQSRDVRRRARSTGPDQRYRIRSLRRCQSNHSRPILRAAEGVEAELTRCQT
ncbi:hypothetical protein [Actinoplanes aureus]|uniref:Nucleotidyl transferase AbiEii/AbiGii toxin family protein n=1 Tax=Actinoplanes aureus TaxID=2792083 RepID=A0A931C6M7_9ACTN|nr:hypothetical protein [Actinoplanes aureus]MBG0563179.1 hypothetical protein [Actinoplanes aureus]